MLQELGLWPQKIKDGLQSAHEFNQENAGWLPSQPTNIVFVGMGGSGIAGRIVHAMLQKHSSFPSMVIEGPSLPKHITKNSLAFVSSYSGNTWETLAVLDELLARGVSVVGLTHGGKVAQRLGQENMPYVALPASKTPRSALGTFLGVLWGLLDEMGVLAAKNIAQKTIDHAHQHIPMLSDSAYFADFLALARDKASFFVWGIADDSDVIARRAQTQFNENSKIAAVYSQFPELAHNLLVGMADTSSEGAVAILFATDFASDQLCKAYRALEQIISQAGVKLYKPPVLGDTWEEQLFHGILWSDYASCHLGMARGVDLVSVDAIDRYKEKLI